MPQQPHQLVAITLADGYPSAARRLARSLLVVLAYVAPLSSALAQAPIQFTVSDDVASCLKVRVRPERSAPDLVCLAHGTQVEAVGVAPYWRQIRLQDGRTGWGAKKFLELVATPPVAPTTDDRNDAWLEVHVVDVGQGDGIWIHTFDDNIPGNGRYEGYNIIVDGGPDAKAPKNQLLRYVMERAHPGAVIDALIVTHPHNDHYLGAEGILDQFAVREYYESGALNTDDWLAFRGLVDAERFAGNPIIKHVGRDSFGTPDWGSELQVRFLYAYTGRTGFGSGGTRVNNASIVFRLHYGSQSILFMGDAEAKERDEPGNVTKYAERFLLDSVGPGALQSTVLKIGHHGSETSTTDSFIMAVRPSHVVVSSGRKVFTGPRYLPDASTLERVCGHNDSTHIYRTDQDDEVERKTGATDADGDHIVISTNGKETKVQAYSAGNPITPTACVP